MQGQLRAYVRRSEFNRLLPMMESVEIDCKPSKEGQVVTEDDIDARGVLTINEVDGTTNRISIFYGREP